MKKAHRRWRSIRDRQGESYNSSTDDVIIFERSESRLWIRDINPAWFNAEGDGIVDGSIHAPTQVFFASAMISH
jgi:hypothetical protein